MSALLPSPIPPGRLSVPKRLNAPPRPLTDSERAVFYAIADTLIPAVDSNPAASQAPGYEVWLDRALAARGESFDRLTQALATMHGMDTAQIDTELRRLHREEADIFQLISTVAAGAYLMVPAVREAVGYPGQHRDLPRLEQAADDLEDGILDPVIKRGFVYVPVG